MLSDKAELDYEKMLGRLDCKPEDFLMIGNSLKSDVLPVLNIGGHAIHIPYHTTWEYEKIDFEIKHENFKSFASITEILPYYNETKIDISSWNRKEHFEFFNTFRRTFWYYNIYRYDYCLRKGEKCKFLFVYYLHKTIAAINQVENFRYRIEENEVVLYDEIDASATIMREDKTFGFHL